MNFKNSVNENDHKRFSANGLIDIFSQESIKNIPRNRLVILNGVPMDSHGLHNYFQSQEPRRRHPLYRNRNVPATVVSAIANKARRTGWSKRSTSNGTAPVPNSERQFAANQARALQEQFQGQMKRQIANILGNNNASASNRILKIATEIRPRLETWTSNTTITIPDLGFKLATQQNPPRLVATWSIPNRQNRMTVSVAAQPFALIDTGVPQSILIPLDTVPRRHIKQAHWLVDPVREIAPGYRTPSSIMTRALLTAIGLSIIDPSNQSNINRMRRALIMIEQQRQFEQARATQQQRRTRTPMRRTPNSRSPRTQQRRTRNQMRVNSNSNSNSPRTGQRRPPDILLNTGRRTQNMLYPIALQENRATLGRSLSYRIKQILRALVRETGPIRVTGVFIDSTKIFHHTGRRLTLDDIGSFVDTRITGYPGMRNRMTTTNTDPTLWVKVTFSFEKTIPSGERILFTDASVNIKMDRVAVYRGNPQFT